MFRSLSKVTAKLLDKVVACDADCLSPMIHRKFRSRWRESEREKEEEKEEGDRKSIRMGVRSVVVAVLCTTHVSAESELLTD